jgi:hypothetical protein
MLARQGKIYQPAAEGGARKPALPEMDDLEQLLNLGTPRSAQAPGTKPAPAADQGGN